MVNHTARANQYGFSVSVAGQDFTWLGAPVFTEDVTHGVGTDPTEHYGSTLGAAQYVGTGGAWTGDKWVSIQRQQSFTVSAGNSPLTLSGFLSGYLVVSVQANEVFPSGAGTASAVAEVSVTAANGTVTSLWHSSPSLTLNSAWGYAAYQILPVDESINSIFYLGQGDYTFTQSLKVEISSGGAEGVVSWFHSTPDAGYTLILFAASLVGLRTLRRR